MSGTEIDHLIHLLARLPGLGPRSARRAALHLIERREALLVPLAETLARTAAAIRVCSVCGNVDTADPCAICADGTRDDGLICVVEDVASLWAMERSGCFRGRYHVLGGLLSALDGIGPEDLGLGRLEARIAAHAVREVIVATPATVEGQTTAHYLAERLGKGGVVLSGLAQGVPMGGELDYLDDGTIGAALRARRSL
jgi:recombination protein RecR